MTTRAGSVESAGGEEFEAGSYLFEAVRVALRAAAATGGLVDPTIGRGLRLAGYDRTFTIVSERDRGGTVRFAPAAGWRLVELDEDRRSIRIPSGVELDLGATAKALAADRAALAAAERTGAGIFVSLGGDIAIAGAAPLGGWPVRIADDHRASLDWTRPGGQSRVWRACDFECHGAPVARGRPRAAPHPRLSHGPARTILLADSQRRRGILCGCEHGNYRRVVTG